MKKIADLTLVINNYGTKLQSYALCKAIKSFGLVEPEVINLKGAWHGSTVKISRKKQLVDVLKTYKLKSFKKIYDFVRFGYQYKKIRENADAYKGDVQRQEELYAEFDKHISYSNDVYTLEDVRAGKLLPNYDMFIVGSDQVWNGPRVGCLDVYMCDFLHQKRSALSYAASFAIDAIPENMREDYTKYIQNMDTLLVREEGGVQLCKQLGRDDAKHVVDPTMLLEGKDYEELISDPTDLIGTKDFILVYSLTTSMKIYEQASKLAEKYNCKMVMLKRGAHPPMASTFKNAIDMIAVGPAEFLSLVKYAKCVVTGSYHALMFSLLLHTDFYIYLDDANAENSRLISSLSMFGLEKQLYYETSSLPKTLPHVDFDAVDKIVNEKREESLRLLRESIEKKM
ncbi:MAG: polysaccharide pyruvyl transferase family protein [Bacteroidaceae bacterium]|nr:polysaccharide pyruvyl transferase family protein [Bacteroidaceae bacterium]